jgi:hypothetical protein
VSMFYLMFWMIQVTLTTDSRFESGIFIKEHPVTRICKLFVLQQLIFQYQPWLD